MALDDDQRQLETLKLCVDYLKHLTTLSGVATVVVLALIERPDTNAQGLFFPAVMFGVATVICLVGMFYLISGFALDFLDKPTAGVGFVGVVTGVFTVSVILLLIGALVSSTTTRLYFSTGLVILWAIGVGLAVVYEKRRR